MKSIKIFGLVLICSFAFLITGCGNGNGKTMNCELNNGSSSMKLEIEFNDAGTKVNKVKVNSTMKFGNEISDSDLEEYAAYSKEQCKETGGSNCNIKLDGKSIVSSYEISGSESLGYEDEETTMDKLKEALEEDGYTCKK